MALVANTGWYLRNFRRNLAVELQRREIDVTLICPRDKDVLMLADEGFNYIEWNLHRRGMLPLRELSSVASLARIYRRLRPHIVHHFTVKCVLYGTWAAKIASVPHIVNSVTGLGHLVLSDQYFTRALRPLVIRAWCKALDAQNSVPIFQNEDDLRLFASIRPQLARRAIIAQGSGIDTVRFAPGRSNGVSDAVKTVLFVGRLLREKGLAELAHASRIIRAAHSDVRFVVCGTIDTGNPSSFSAADCDRWRRDNVFEIRGHVTDIERVYNEADLVVLPSYREGLPRVLLEAGACARAVVATDVAGCRDVVVHGETGLLVPVRDARALAQAIRALLNDPDRCQSMGMAARERIAEFFSDDLVVRQTLSAYQCWSND